MSTLTFLIRLEAEPTPDRDELLTKTMQAIVRTITGVPAHNHECSMTTTKEHREWHCTVHIKGGLPASWLRDANLLVAVSPIVYAYEWSGGVELDKPKRANIGINTPCCRCDAVEPGGNKYCRRCKRWFCEVCYDAH